MVLGICNWGFDFSNGIFKGLNIMEDAIKWVADNWDKIPNNYKQLLSGDRYGGGMSSYVNGLPADEHFVVLLLDRQKPSVIPSYDFDEERIGVTRTGKIIWGFDSGCSCPSPWSDSFPDCYNVSKEWKEFEIQAKDFDIDWEKECLERVEEIKKNV